MEPTPHSSRVWARWRHQVRSPLHQIIGYNDLLMEMLENEGDNARDLLNLLRQVRKAGEMILDQLKSVEERWRMEPQQSTLETMAAEMLLPFETIEWCITEAREIVRSSDISEPLVLDADLVRLQEGVRRLRLSLEEMPVDESEPPFISVASGSDSPAVASDAVDASSLEIEPLLSEADQGAVLLVVDDERINREVLSRRLERMGYVALKAENGQVALKLLGTEHIDLVMLDVVMPEMDGYQVLEHIHDDSSIDYPPVIMLTAVDEAPSIARCLNLGAADYVPKPFDATVLRARIHAALERKRLRDREREYLERIRREMAKSESLLLNVLPESIAVRLKQGERQIVDLIDEATVMFADIVGFTRFANKHSAKHTMELLSDLFSAFDQLVDSHGLEKIKTIGDAYMVVAGVPEPVEDHAQRTARMALALMRAVEKFNAENQVDWSLRIGFHSGEVMAGIIGKEKFAYDLWGDTVNVASRLESHGEPGCITLSAETAELLGDGFQIVPRGHLDLRNRGEMAVVQLVGERG